MKNLMATLVIASFLVSGSQAFAQRVNEEAASAYAIPPDDFADQQGTVGLGSGSRARPRPTNPAVGNQRNDIESDAFSGRGGPRVPGRGNN